MEDPQIEQLNDCSKYDKVGHGCAWTQASSTHDVIEGFCVAVPVLQLDPGLQGLYDTTYYWRLDISELEFQDECRSLTLRCFGGMTIALL